MVNLIIRTPERATCDKADTWCCNYIISTKAGAQLVQTTSHNFCSPKKKILLCKNLEGKHLHDQEVFTLFLPIIYWLFHFLCSASLLYEVGSINIKEREKVKTFQPNTAAKLLFNFISLFSNKQETSQPNKKTPGRKAVTLLLLLHSSYFTLAD